MNCNQEVSANDIIVNGVGSVTEDFTKAYKSINEVLDKLPIESKTKLLSLLSQTVETEDATSESSHDSSDSDYGEEAPLYSYPNVPATPNRRAPKNVMSFRCSQTGAPLGWRNVFNLPISYDLEVVPGCLNPSGPHSGLADFMQPHNGPRRRFLVIDEAVDKLYGAQIRVYFEAHGVQTHVVVLPGEECSKRYQAVDTILEECCKFGLHRREPIVGIGGGVILDIVGMAANLYRRGVPYFRVPTTLLALVDASVGVKNGVDYCSVSKGPQKNRIGSFYAPSAVYLDKSFVATQDKRNIVNGLGEIMKLALVRSTELFNLLEEHGERLVLEKFQGQDKVADRVIELSIEIMLEELGPNLWEYKLERCVDFGHTFSKIIEMQPNADIMHGEAVNIDGFLCVLISHRRGLITLEERNRIFACMTAMGLPTTCDFCTMEVLKQGLIDAVEHRHGAQRIPLVKGIGGSVVVNDITPAELEVALRDLVEVHSTSPHKESEKIMADPTNSVSELSLKEKHKAPADH
uniref:3-dehydroquinate synthase domain-containing protein n=1 Tax=Fibrocapsa japonica TaxID=94617 RepID=A0A7S2Y0A6_9STRA|mmetsp:Transcript_18412/g.26769  ORF Transcript_18412/g.26769 Transcript_18412/m.26769 type:complete len:519 (+) Transcript_18412:124-1680(+)|eukprot:CAMPEP_0113936842 /NCGR_PEP_ID=MMETSP1339-20121228/3617_1 /TAXON_ID=94617 /ORGANISM="Fibrocapsa japonica" /LENGTH=518 /DNA_ID=CAMNT_0000939403 /DNA_START=102 /DNA_END=1658 /DNA_ORIENTATION=- /assembly_acc=CAM_ASM_000762